MERTPSSFFKFPFLVFVLTFSFAFANPALAAWTEPTTNPTGGNTPSPLNTGSENQVKTGGIWAGSLGTDGGATFGGNASVTSGNSFLFNGASDLNRSLGNITGDGVQVKFWNFLDFFASSVSPSGASIMRILNNGNVGIGTVSPSTRLETYGVIRAAGNAADYGGWGTGPWAVEIGRDNTNGYLGSYDRSASTYKPLYLFASKILLNGNGEGNVGIGTASPGYKLDVAGDINLTGTLRQNGSAIGGSQWTTSGSNIYYSGGNVGIGTAGPGAKLDVEGGGVILGTTGTNSNTRTLTILNQGSSQVNFGSYPGQWSPALQIQNNDASRYVWISALDSASGGNARLVTGGTNFDIMPGNTQVATFTTGGNVGIGTASPASKLTVSGNTEVNGEFRVCGGAGCSHFAYPSGGGSNYLRGTLYFNSILYDENNTAYYLDPASTSIFNDLRSNIFYDNNDTGYYLDPNGTSNLNALTSSTRARLGLPDNWTNRQGITSDTSYWTGAQGWGYTDLNSTLPDLGSTFFDVWGTDMPGSPFGGGYQHFQGLQAYHYWNGSYGYGSQLVFDAAGYGAGSGIYYRRMWGGGWGSWRGICLSDGTGCPAQTGDNLGNHTATQALNMNISDINNIGHLHFYGNGGNSGQAGDYYGIYQESGPWTNPYPDLVIQYHTGIKYSTYSGYGGHRFYTGYDGTGNPATLSFSVGEGDGNTRVYGDLYVQNVGGWLTSYLNQGVRTDNSPTFANLTLNGGQIKFPATQNPSSDPNTLDAYAEGTWTPALSFSHSSAGITYMQLSGYPEYGQYGYYTRIGRMVFAVYKIYVTNKGTATGMAFIEGLPFTGRNSPTGGIAGSGAVNQINLNTSWASINATVFGGVNYASLIGARAGGSSVSTLLTETDFFSTTNYLQGTIIYETN